MSDMADVLREKFAGDKSTGKIWATPDQIAAALSTAGFGPAQEERDALAKAADLVRDMIDPDDCHFDHHGGCQAHGYLSLQIGELCPQLEAKVWLYNRKDT